MKKIKKNASASITFYVLGALAVFGLSLSGAVAAPSEETPRVDAPRKFSYAVQFTCGFDPDGAFTRIVPGQYATTVNIHNPNDRPVFLMRRIALTFPDAKGGSAPLAGLVSESLESALLPAQALQVDCGEIPSEFLPDLPLPPYIQGFLLIESTASLDVTAVYTAAMVDGEGGMDVRSIDVESVPERRR